MTDMQIDNTLNGLPEGFNLEKLIGPPPPPPDGSVPFSAKDAYSSKEAKAAEKAFDRQADAFAAGRVNKTLLRKFGHIAAAIPGAERIRVRKRRENGNLGYIGEYNFRDIQSTGDVEVFIARTLKPVHGPGEYDTTIIDQHGREFPAGSVFIEGIPVETAGNNSMVDLVRELTARNNAPQPPPPDPLETMRKAQAFAKELKDSSGSNDPVAMIMAMQAFAPRAPTGPDPMVLSVLERISAKLEKVEAAAAVPPLMSPLPPPPPEKSVDWIALGSSVVLPLLQMFQTSQQAQAQMQMQMAQENTRTMMALMGNKDGLSTKDLLALMNEQHNRSLELLQRKTDETRPQNTIEDQMEAMVKMKEFATAFAPPAPAGPQGASFWDALVALASSQDIAGAVSDRIRQRNERAAALPQNAQAQVVHQRPVTAAPAGAMAAPAQAQPQIPIPSTLKDDAAKIAMAGDPPTRVQATIETLINLEKDPNFSKFVRALLEATAKNETDHTLRGLGGWLKMLVDNGLLTREVALAVLKDFKENWDVIRDLLIERVPMLKAMAVNVTPATAAPATAAPTTTAAPVAVVVDPLVPNDVEIPAGYGSEEGEAPAVVS